MRILVILASVALVAAGGPAPAQTGSVPQTPPGRNTSSPPKPQPSGAADAMADCMRLWDKGTHMTKAQWASTCKRIQTRLDNLKIENLDLKGIGIRRRSGTTPQGRIDSSNRSN